ncbi:MAG: DUF4411 family protein [Vicinamibacteria bacterium]|nr:DUF4411 family protein [Vicinamibacteria bacterium]
MIYVFDTSSFRVLKNFYPPRFPTLWRNVGSMIEAEQLISVREVSRELKDFGEDDLLKALARKHKGIFAPPDADEQTFVQRIFSKPHFRALISQRALLQGKPVADPFVIAAAATRAGTVVTQESLRPNAARIPNVCRAFDVPYVDLEDFMAEQGWEF